MDLIGKKRTGHQVHLHDPQYASKKDALRSIRRTVKLKLREMQGSWLSARADEIQSYADQNDMKNIYSSLKEVFGLTSAGSSLLLSTDRTKLILEKNEILQKRAKCFDGVLNRPSSINNKAIEWVLQVPVNESLDVTLKLEEVQIDIRQLSSCKAPGSDSIPAEIYKEGGSPLTDKRLTLIPLIRAKEQLPHDFKDASNIHIYKWKENRQACDNHRRISLLSISGKLLVRVLLNPRNNQL